MNYSINQKAVSEKVIEDTLQYIDISDYEGLTTKKEVIEEMLKSVETRDNKNNMQKKVYALVYGGCFKIYNHEILEFLETLELNETTMKRAKKDPMKIYADTMWHAIKRYVK